MLSASSSAHHIHRKRMTFIKFRHFVFEQEVFRKKEKICRLVATAEIVADRVIAVGE